MKKFLISIGLTLTLLLFSCSSTSSLENAYIHALEALLEEQDFSYDFDYISFYINDTEISDQEIDYIRRHFQQTYEKKIYSYTPKEVKHAGPYGKEHLNMDGMFLYVLDIEHAPNEMKIETAKYHTLSERGALGMEVLLKRHNNIWQIEQEEILWRE